MNSENSEEEPKDEETKKSKEDSKKPTDPGTKESTMLFDLT